MERSFSSHRLQKENDYLPMVYLVQSDKLQIISALKQFFLSCFGPCGRAKYVQNKHGALMTLSSSSHRLVSSLTFVNPISQLVASSVKQHLAAFSDNGSFMAVFLLSLVEGALKDNIHHQLCCEINIDLMKLCLVAMDEITFTVKLSNIDSMFCLVRSIFKSKSACSLSTAETDILCSLVLQILVSALPDNKPQMVIPCVEYKTIAGHPVSKTKLINGVLLEVPRSFHKLLSAWKTSILHNHDNFKVALFDTSLSIDKDPLPGVTIEAGSDVDVEEYEIQQMERLASKLEGAGVTLVGCQKVIHPSLMKKLAQRGILCLDRLSLVYIGAVVKLTGASPLSSMNCDVPVESLGYLTDVATYDVFDQRLLHLTSSERSVTTIILCHRTEACLEELKHLFSVAYHVACLSINHPEVVPGCGRFESWLSMTIREKLAEVKEDTCSRLQCTHHQFMQVAGVFLRSLENITTAVRPSQVTSTMENFEADQGGCQNINLEIKLNSLDLSDTNSPSTKTLKLLTKRCFEEGIVETDWSKEVVDLMLVKKNAFKMAVEMANMILSISCVIGTTD